jgi:hypothetical protein
LFMWSNMSFVYCILHAKNLHLKNKMLYRLLDSWMLQNVFHTSISLLQDQMWTSCFKQIGCNDGHIFLTLILYTFFMFASTHDDGASSMPLIISHKS